jgi:hypothetical protein
VSASVEPTAEPTGAPAPTPSQEAALALAIASGIEVVGESAAFSPDGEWFAFTARPADGSGGPDIHVWRVGDPSARAITDDGRSVFGSWAGDQVVGSRTEDAAPPESEPITFLLDPASGAEGARIDNLWRPVVDPAQERAVAWVGTVDTAGDGAAPTPADGRLELRPWPDAAEGSDADAARVVAEAPIAGYDVRWDESGEWVGVWILETADAGSGRLTLYHVDPATGELSQPDGAPADEPALAGFSIGDGRLAWATPPGHDGEGSRVQVVAWRDGSVGTVETVPGEDVVVVR